jgi:hypothetical protein
MAPIQSNKASFSFASKSPWIKSLSQTLPNQQAVKRNCLKENPLPD